MRRKVVQLQSKMDARVNEVVQLALSQQKPTAGLQLDVIISLASQRCASIVAPNVAARHPKIKAAAEYHQMYPMDDITTMIACELHVSYT